MQWYKKLRGVEWIASLIQMVWSAWKQIASTGGAAMSWIMGWLPEWLMVILVAIAGVYLFTLVESLAKKKIKERNKKESQQKKSNSEKPGEMFGSAVVQVRSAKDASDRYKAESEAEETAKELAKLRSDFKAFKQKYGRWFLQWCGSTASPIGLSVSVQFIEPHDSNLAKQIKDAFSSFGGVWKIKPINQIKWQQNPSNQTRIVIFSDHERAHGMNGIKGTLNTWCLLDEERVDLYPKELHMSEDVTIIVFNKGN